MRSCRFFTDVCQSTKDEPWTWNHRRGPPRVPLYRRELSSAIPANIVTRWFTSRTPRRKRGWNVGTSSREAREWGPDYKLQQEFLQSRRCGPNARCACVTNRTLCLAARIMNSRTRNWFGSRLGFVPRAWIFHSYAALSSRYFQFLSPSIFFFLEIQFIGCFNDYRSNDYELILIFSFRAIHVTKRKKERTLHVLVLWILVFRCNRLVGKIDLLPILFTFHSYALSSIFPLGNTIFFIGCLNDYELILIFSLRAIHVAKQTNEKLYTYCTLNFNTFFCNQLAGKIDLL